MTRRHLVGPFTLAELIRHCQLFMSDRAINECFDTVTSCAASEADAKVLARYRRARRKAPGWSPGSWLANSHRNISADVLAELTEGSATTKRAELTCQSCGSVFTSRRSDALSCSPKCRQSRRRSGPRSMSRMHAVNAVPQVPTPPGVR
jgi:hypothetical protein